jgi:AcrR family transcriptional regulator
MIRIENAFARPNAQKDYRKAALRLVTKRGFRAVTVDQIAAEAGVGKMTIYRRWPSKAALVMDSLMALVGNETDFTEAATAIESLRQQLYLQVAFFRSARGNLIRSLVAEAQSDPELAEAFRDRWLHPRRDGVRRTLRAAIKEGSLRRDIDIAAAIDLLYGSLHYRLLLGSGALNQRFIAHAFRQLMGAWHVEASLYGESWQCRLSF